LERGSSGNAKNGGVVKVEGIIFLSLLSFLTYFLSQLFLYHCIDQIDEVDKIGGIDETDHPF